MSSRAPAFALSVFIAWTLSIAASADQLAELPLVRVVLFNAGLGYFEHEARVNGTVASELKFADSDVNDLLKSLVLQDLGGGKIKAVSLPSQAPVAERLREFSFDLSSEPTLAELLHQLRGERIGLDDGKIVGIILGVELKERTVGNQVSREEVLNLLADEGLRSITLSSVKTIQLQNAKVDQELRSALALLATRRDSEKKSVRFEFAGKGERTVRVGYIRQVPIWKTTYRLVTQTGQPAMLQGWAILENTSESDWTDVSVTLMSGRPVTFEMNLYRPLFVEREELPPSVPSSVTSRLYTPALRGLDFANPAIPYAGAEGAIAKSSKQRPAVNGSGGFGGGGFGYGSMGMSGGGMGGGLGGAAMPGMGGSGMLSPAPSITVEASGTDVGEQFQYRIESPVNLARQRTALIPIVNQAVTAEKVSVFTVDGDQEFPMRAMKITNTTPVKLVQGPLTVFDESAYAGDAQLNYLPQAEQQLFNYAQDMELRVRSTISTNKRTFKQSKRGAGTLALEFLSTRHRKYRIENRSDEIRPLILEQPRGDKNWRLESHDQVLESTDTHHRFKIDVLANKTVEYTISEQQTETELHALASLELKTLEEFLALPLADEAKSLIRQLRDLRVRVMDLESVLQLDQSALAAITAEQDRIRANLSALARDSELAKNYIAKMTEQEAKLDSVQNEIQQHKTQLAQTQQQLQRLVVSVRSNEQEDPFR